MTIRKFSMSVLGGMVLAAAGSPAVEPTPDTGQLRQTLEVIEVLKARYVDREKLDDKSLNDATTKGILAALGQGATIVTPAAAGTNPPAPVAVGELVRAEVIEPEIGYIRIADAMPAAVPVLDAELKKLAAAKVQGYVLDLRFADGTDYAAASEIASRFLGDGHELFAVRSVAGGAQGYRSKAGAAAKEMSGQPLMVLVNGATTGSAEVLAGALQAQERAVVIGSQTAGSAANWEEVKLSDGRVLRIATAKVVLPSRQDKAALTVSVFPAGVTPDVPVKVDAKLERELVLNLQTNVSVSASLQARETKKRMAEADLVKAFRGEAVDIKTPGTKDENADETPQATDVVLQRAVDILKGIRVLLSSSQE